MNLDAINGRTPCRRRRVDAIPYPRDLDNDVLGASFLTGNLDEAAKFVLDRVAGHREPDRV
jgi:hypothetical protein